MTPDEIRTEAAQMAAAAINQTSLLDVIEVTDLPEDEASKMLDLIHQYADTIRAAILGGAADPEQYAEGDEYLDALLKGGAA